jgi:uncharacterized membrane protein (DUF106 family)
METTMLNIKFLLFLAMEAFVVAVVVAALIAGLYQIIRDKILESRRLDKLVPEAPATPTGNATTHRS